MVEGDDGYSPRDGVERKQVTATNIDLKQFLSKFGIDHNDYEPEIPGDDILPFGHDWRILKKPEEFDYLGDPNASRAKLLELVDDEKVREALVILALLHDEA